VANNAARAARMRAARSARRTTGNKGDWVDLTAKDCIPAALRS
jgi:hypothetical protein